MKRILLALSALFFTSVLIVDDAEARRLGGARPSGVQRQAVPERPAAPPAAQQTPSTAPAAAGIQRTGLAATNNRPVPPQAAAA